VGRGLSLLVELDQVSGGIAKKGLPRTAREGSGVADLDPHLSELLDAFGEVFDGEREMLALRRAVVLDLYQMDLLASGSQPHPGNPEIRTGELR
jgi:hypothetical protein